MSDIFSFDDSDELAAKLDRLLAEGKIDERDVEEVERFGAFLTDLAQYPPEATKARAQIYFQHYPEHRPAGGSPEEELL